jgi:hypothetical protein
MLGLPNMVMCTSSSKKALAKIDVTPIYVHIYLLISWLWTCALFFVLLEWTLFLRNISAIISMPDVNRKS